MDIKQLAQDITNQSEAIRKRRVELPEPRRPKDIAGMKKLRREVELYVKKNDEYQRTIDTFRHTKNRYERGGGLSHDGDEFVRPAWEAKTRPTQQPPWPFDTNFRELIKILHHCYSPVLLQLKNDIASLVRLINATSTESLTKKSVRICRIELARITSSLNWLRENERIHFLNQIDSSGKESVSFQVPSPGVPDMMNDAEKELAAVREKFDKLEEKFFSQKGHNANSKRLLVTVIVGSFTVAGFFLKYGSSIRDYLFSLFNPAS